MKTIKELGYATGCCLCRDPSTRMDKWEGKCPRCGSGLEASEPMQIMSELIDCPHCHTPREVDDICCDGVAVDLMRDAIQEFVDRCERDEVLSKYTYAKFKEILDRVG